MRTTKAAIGASILTFATITASIVMLLLGENREIKAPQILADLWRAVIVLMVVYALGLMLLMIKKIMSVRISPDDRMIVPLYILFLGLFCSQIFIATFISSRIGKIGISWATPLGFVSMILIDIGVSILTRRISDAVKDAAEIKMVITKSPSESHDPLH